MASGGTATLSHAPTPMGWVVCPPLGAPGVGKPIRALEQNPRNHILQDHLEARLVAISKLIFLSLPSQLDYYENSNI